MHFHARLGQTQETVAKLGFEPDVGGKKRWSILLSWLMGLASC